MSFLLFALMLNPLCASPSRSTILVSRGAILYPPSPTGENLAVIPGTWGDYHILGYVSGEGGIFHLDTTVNHNGNPSIREDYPRNDDSANEVNSAYIPLKPGDHVYCSCWIKTEFDTVGSGAIFGMDLYGTERLWEVHPRTDDDMFLQPSQRSGSALYVPYGSDWTFMEFEFAVPTYQFANTDYGTPITPQYVSGAIPWLTASWGSGETSRVWWSEFTIYVNP